MEFIFELDSISTVASRLVEMTKQYKIFAFSGEFGSGKTTFISSMCKSLGVNETVSSPTYSLIQEYKTGNAETIYHIDLYRIKSASEATEAGIEDCLYSGEICLAEWPERAPAIFPAETVFCTFHIQTATRRKLEIKLPE